MREVTQIDALCYLCHKLKNGCISVGNNGNTWEIRSQGDSDM